ncbi:hypothetical protein GCM10007876_33140 [Litoribrevibacter albus]|uniref:Uncharacterized protein n=1 Tax=Litoribrevibacter albus TaxID=1473156 RepID=A0AA37SBD9_9GAMM|nr:hypothetical protein GCM10007876_33140 [Litoribrevibacter albus]
MTEGYVRVQRGITYRQRIIKKAVYKHALSNKFRQLAYNHTSYNLSPGYTPLRAQFRMNKKEDIRQQRLRKQYRKNQTGRHKKGA